VPAPGKLTEQAVRAAGVECADLAAGAERLGVADLAGRLGRSKRLTAAWERGRLLRRVGEVAGTTYVVAEAADRLLGLAKGTFGPLYAADRVVRELWDRRRFDLLLATEQGWAARVREGDPKALAAVEELFESRRPAAQEADFTRLAPAELGRATGILPQQWARWVRENGCPQAVDGTYSLARVIAWLRAWERDKAGGGQEARGLNPLQTEKAEILALEKKRRLGQLVELPVHLAALAQRAHALRVLLAPGRAHELAEALAGQTAGQIEDRLRGAFGAVLSEYRTLSPEIPLAEAARAKIEEGLKMIVEG
jgi:hypothetical protein